MAAAVAAQDFMKDRREMWNSLVAMRPFKGLPPVGVKSGMVACIAAISACFGVNTPLVDHHNLEKIAELACCSKRKDD